MSIVDIKYAHMLEALISSGVESPDRTGTGTYSIFGYQERFDLTQFPLLTTKKVSFKNIVAELLWFLSGSTNIHDLHKHGCHIWDEWADENGDLGPIYGYQWRSFDAGDGFTDQISELMDNLVRFPESRRHVVTAWNPSYTPRDAYSPQHNVQMGAMALAPCHCLFQMNVRNGILNCHMYQRSADVFLGVPYNIASYALLTHLIAHQLNLHPGELIISYGDLHLYKNHLNQAREQLERDGRAAPFLSIENKHSSIFDYKIEDFYLLNYEPHPAISAPISV